MKGVAHTLHLLAGLAIPMVCAGTASAQAAPPASSPAAGGLFVVLFGVVSGLVCIGGIIVLTLVPFVALPLVYSKRILAWTEGRTPWEAYDALEEGGTRGFFQLRPASYLWEDTYTTDEPAAGVLERTAGNYSRFIRKVLARDEEGIVVSERVPLLGNGWVGAVLVSETGETTTVRVRFRATWMTPVLTFFLSLTLRLHLRRLIIGR